MTTTYPANLTSAQIERLVDSYADTGTLEDRMEYSIEDLEHLENITQDSARRLRAAIAERASREG